MKKGYLFSTDALIAVVIIISVVIVVAPVIKTRESYNSISEDLIKTFSNLKMGEIDNDYARQIVLDDKIDEEKSLLEAISELNAEGKEEGRLLAESILQNLDIRDNVGIWLDNQFIASKNTTPIEDSEKIFLAGEIVSGVEAGREVKGFSSRAYLKSIKRTKYVYFGGYVGDGNISVEVNISKISRAEIEAAFGKDFDIYINGVASGSYSALGGETPLKIDLDEYLQNFQDGRNVIEFRGNNLYVSGGFLKIEYDDDSAWYGEEKKNFPGISGMVNLYDSFYVPSDIESMTIYLHYQSPYNIFLTIGNKTVYRGNSSTEKIEVLDDSHLSALLDYDDMKKKTNLLRIGLENVSYNMSMKRSVDSVLVTDISGSMADCVEEQNVWTCEYSCKGGLRKMCNVSSPSSCTGNICGGTCTNPRNHYVFKPCNRTKLDFAKVAAKQFVDVILNDSGNNVGLVAYSTSVLSSNVQLLTNNKGLLFSKIDAYNEGGNTCICCGINNAVNVIKNSSKIKTILVMSDGIANQVCAQQGTWNPVQDAVNAACQAYDNYNITVHAVGFGSDVDETTLRAIADCGHGNYSLANATSIIEIYSNIAEVILNAAYSEQTIAGENIYTRLYEDSYISYDYKKNYSTGLVFDIETEEFGNIISEGNFSVPDDAEVIEAKVLSYSGSKWTSLVQVENSLSYTVFNLSRYEKDFTILGDPYVVYIPLESIGKENLVRVKTGIGGNISGGSQHNKIVYRLIKPYSGYSDIVASAQGCIWNVEFDDGLNMTFAVPTNYTGSSRCSFRYGNIAFNSNDAIDKAVYDLFSDLDIDGDGRIDTKFSQNSLKISSSEIQGIPFSWSGNFQVRVWR